MAKPPSPNILEPGTSVGGYEILAQIGGGAIGIVFHAKHQLLGREVAIKVLRPELAQQEDISSRFLAEARAINDLAHPNIVRIQDFARDDSVSPPLFYMVMDLLRGCSLGERVRKKGPLGVDEAFAIAKQVARALSVVHSTKRVHRDLKSDNVFLVPDSDGGYPIVKLLDFGLVKAIDEELPEATDTDPGTAVGTPAYMAPEQILEGHVLDQRVDIYALGIVLYEMLAGEVPFTSKSFGQLMIEIVKDAPKPLAARRPKIPPRVDALVQRCLAKAPADRFESVAALEQAIEELGCALCGHIHTDGACAVDDSWDAPAHASSSVIVNLERPAELTIEAEPGGEATLPAGSVIGAYRVVDVIGRGGMGIVYRAIHESLQRPVALKLLRDVYAAQGNAVERVFHEALAASRINHPNIVAITDFIQEKGVACYVMEYLEGQPLSATLKQRGSLPVDEVLAMGEQVASGLAALHQAGVVHRDLKPGNIFLAEREGHAAQVKLLDFGLAALSRDVTADHIDLQGGAANPALATPEYCAPEQIGASFSIDHRADIYSLGVVLYTALAGERPHRSSGNELLIDIGSKIPQSLGERGVELPKRLDALVASCLSIEPEGRPATAVAVLEELRAITREQAVAAAQLRSRARRRWELLALALVVLLAGGYLLWQQRSKPKPVLAPKTQKPAERPIARLEALQGQVTHRRRDQVAFVPAQPKLELLHLDTLKTEARSRARVSFHAGGKLDIRPYSTVLVEAPEAEGKPPVARLTKGTMHAQVLPGNSLRLIAPGGRESIVEARGDKPLRLRVRQRKDGLEVAVLRGRGRIASAGHMAGLASGQFVDVGGPSLQTSQLPAFPELLSPEVDGVISGTVVLRWKATAGAQAYRVQLGATTSLSDPLLDQLAEKNRFVVEPLKPGRYVWRVSAIDGQKRESEFGFSRRFTVAGKETFSSKAFSPHPNAVFRVLKGKALVLFRWPKGLTKHRLVIERGGRVIWQRSAKGRGTRVRLALGAYRWRLIDATGKAALPARLLTVSRWKPPSVVPEVHWQRRKRP